MVDLTTLHKTTKHLIDGGEVVLEARPYLGMSQLGHECSRYLWYGFRWYFTDTTSPRMVRLWARGHREEEHIIALLEKTGATCSGEQLEAIAGFGHIKGHCDGMAKGIVEAPKTVHLLEFKTVNDKGFKDLQKKKLKAYSSTYFGQVQLYMHFFKLTRTLFVAVNKNDDSLYVERLYYDKGFAEDLVRKGESIVLAELPPPRAFPSATFFKCKWCTAKEQCWSNAPPVKSCRSCNYGMPALEGRWECDFPETSVEIPLKIQRTGCKNYKVQLNEG